MEAKDWQPGAHREASGVTGQTGHVFPPESALASRLERILAPARS